MQKIVLSGLLLVMISSIVFSQTSDCDYLVKYAPTGWEGNKSVAFQLDEEGNVLSKDENVTVKGLTSRGSLVRIHHRPQTKAPHDLVRVGLFVCPSTNYSCISLTSSSLHHWTNITSAIVKLPLLSDGSDFFQTRKSN
jgi:hypothetical protein